MLRKIKDNLKNVGDWIRAPFVTGFQDWIESAKVPGLRAVEIQLFKNYIIRYSPIYIRQESKDIDYAKGTFSYGEVSYPVAAEIVREIGVTENDVFYDLGCGRGKMMFYTRLSTGATCIGVDLLPTHIHIAEKITQGLGINKLHFFLEDIVNVDLSTGSVVFIHGTTFPDEVHNAVSRNIDKMKTGSRFISVSRPYDNQRLELIKKKNYFVSWGECTVLFYRVR
ncbi:MAG: methyltransferase domain-containing protein [Candidatus Eremiobacteraeota bacterium]|nr:methyltransferase domain-containing protein [Candidatus Eremiobacteraeota bacterium]